MKSKAAIFLEYLWLGVAAISSIAGLYEWYLSNLKNSSIFFIMTFISLLMFSFRRSIRKKQENQN